MSSLSITARLYPYFRQAGARDLARPAAGVRRARGEAPPPRPGPDPAFDLTLAPAALAATKARSHLTQ